METGQPSIARRFPVGAEIAGNGASFRLWAPARRQVAIAVEGGDERTLDPEGNGYFSGFLAGVGTGARYRVRLDDDRDLYPDPASRCQPDGPHGPSQIVDPGAYAWRDGGWRGAALPGQVIYEMHVGTFSPEGTWAAAVPHLPKLKDIGITLIEMMPVNDFPGRFGWGYDGVGLFAPTRLYGAPDDLRRFIDAAHGLGIGVILDVVYNHFGPDGNFFQSFTPYYFTDAHVIDWGVPINFDGPNAAGVRAFFTANAAYWIDEFHFDGLRLDATQALFDESPTHIMADVATAARRAAGTRSIVIVAENEPQLTEIVEPPAQGGYGLDALWNDDFHHSAVVAMTGRSEAYYHDHAGSPQEFISAVKYGYLFQGQRYDWQEKRRGTPGLDIAPAHFVNFIQNHDQIANSGVGLRFHQLTTPGRARAMTALMLLAPQTPMLFQGQEFFASAPFFYFAEFADAALNRSVHKGRLSFLSQFQSLADEALARRIPIPSDPETFAICKLDWSEFDANAEAVALHRDLLRLRREDPVFAAQPSVAGGRGRLDGAVLGPEAFVLRFFGAARGDDRLLIVNLGRTLIPGSIADPLVAPPRDGFWSPLWSSEDPRYGGSGTPPVEGYNGWHIPGHTAVVLTVSAAHLREPSIRVHDVE